MNSLKKAVFFDRDGVINKERKDHVKTVAELEIFPDIVEPIKRLKNAGFLIIVITNQSAINRGLTTDGKINQIHTTIQSFLKKNGTAIDRFYYCSHRPDENCDCRKPKPGLLVMAADQMDIDLKSSWLIGDKDTDLQAATQAGCRAIKIDNEINLAKAAELILDFKI
jgi:histidinol-phosphate phosphatase family protein